MRQNEPKGRKPDDYQCGNDNDDHAHVVTLSTKAAAGVDHVQKKFRDDDGPPIDSVHIRTRGCRMLFAHLKRILKLDRLRLRGPNGAHDEFLLAATGQGAVHASLAMATAPIVLV